MRSNKFELIINLFDGDEPVEGIEFIAEMDGSGSLFERSGVDGKLRFRFRDSGIYNLRPTGDYRGDFFTIDGFPDEGCVFALSEEYFGRKRLEVAEHIYVDFGARSISFGVSPCHRQYLGICEDVDKYLRRNIAGVGCIDGNASAVVSCFDRDLRRGTVFLSGEPHGIKADYELQWQWLEFFRREAGVANSIQEIGPADEYIITRYLETGNEQFLDLFMRAFKNTVGCIEEYAQFFRRLREYNAIASEDARVRVFGVDVQHNFYSARWCLRKIFRRSVCLGNNLKELLTELSASNGWSKQLIESVRFVYSEIIDANDRKYRDCLGGDYDLFLRIIKNIVFRFDCYDFDGRFVRHRDEYMYSNFCEICKIYRSGKYYGQLGKNHVRLEAADYIPFAAYLEKAADSPVKNEVLVMEYWHQDSQMLVIDQIAQKYYTKPVDDYLLPVFEQLAKNDITLFKLNNVMSPFRLLSARLLLQKPSGDFYMPAEISGKITDYWQYMLLIKKSRAATPYGATINGKQK